MLFAGHFAGATIIPLDFNPAGVNATAYAAQSGAGKWIVIINKDENQDIALRLEGVAPVFGEALVASSLSSTQVTFGGHRWTELGARQQMRHDLHHIREDEEPGNPPEGSINLSGKDVITVPRSSALLIYAN